MKTAYLKPFSSLDVNIHCYRWEVARCVFVRTILQIGFQRPSCLSCRKGWKNSELIFFFFLNIRFWIFYSTIFLSKSSKYFQEWKFKNSFPIISVFNHILFAINYKVRSKSRTKYLLSKIFIWNSQLSISNLNRRQFKLPKLQKIPPQSILFLKI